MHRMETLPLIGFAEMAEWVWAGLARGADDAEHALHLLTMATVSPDGRPNARVMTNRGVDRLAGRVWFYTRMDTPKVADLHARSAVCVVGYDRACGVQVRLNGTVRVHQRDAMAEEHWGHIAQVAQWLYQLPDLDRESPVGIDPRLPQDREKLTAGLTARSRAQFGVIEMMVETVDWLQANGREQRRAVMHASDRWIVHPVDA
jgi:pyridoxamine 5'-phosphate oxidase